jgi:hypothetical protein
VIAERKGMVPQVEIVVICHKPMWGVNDENNLTKYGDIETVRFASSPDGLRMLAKSLLEYAAEADALFGPATMAPIQAPEDHESHASDCGRRFHPASECTCHVCEEDDEDETAQKERLRSRPEDITDARVEAVEDAVGMGAAGWDCIEPKEVIAAADNTK